MSSPRLTLPQVYLQPHQLPKIQPRYITDTPVTDKEEAKKHDSALQRAKFALGVLTKRRNKSRGSVAGTGEGNVPEENMKPPPPVPSMYDKEEWPKRHPNGGIQESWSAIGYPTNLDLVSALQPPNRSWLILRTLPGSGRHRESDAYLKNSRH